MRLSPLALAATLLFHPALAAAQQPPLAPTATPAPPPPTGHHTPTLRYKTHSPALMDGGIALVVLGGISLASGVGVIIWDQGRGANSSFPRGIWTGVAAIPLLVHAAGCIAGGIPMILIGSRQIPAGYAGAAPSPVPSISLGPTTTLRWTF